MYSVSKTNLLSASAAKVGLERACLNFNAIVSGTKTTFGVVGLADGVLL
jgi:hypothetical protein